ncbi:recombinase family protein [Streptomyces mirabilis]|uniref:recombinase family protein n=1 Tax=Streptomyces mirabilis TaxID=68239 RepID=UPI0033C3EB51
MNDVRIGYARCSTDQQDLTAQRDYLLGARVPEAGIHLDHGLSGKDRARPALDTALAQISGARQAAPAGTTVTLVVPKLDRLGRSIRDLHDIADEVTDCGGRLEFAGKVYDPTDAMDKMFFNILATFAEFERDLLVQRTKEGMAVAKAKGKLTGGKPKLGPAQRKHLRELYSAGTHTITDLQTEFKVGRATVYRIIQAADAS